MFHPSVQKIFEENMQATNDFLITGEDYAMVMDCLEIPSPSPSEAESELAQSTSTEEDQQSLQQVMSDSDIVESTVCPNPINMQSFRIVETVEPFQERGDFTAQDSKDYVFMWKQSKDTDDSQDETASVTTTSGCSTTSSRASLEDNNNITTVQSDQWKARYRELVDYHVRYGNVHIPYDWKPNKRLSQWVKRQRHQRRLRKEGKHSNLTEERERMLDDLGFIWDSRAANWEERLNELVEFKAQNGHCKVTTKYTAYRPLAVWLKRQRHAVREYLNGTQDTGMTEDRVSRLFDMGVSMNIKQRTVMV